MKLRYEDIEFDPSLHPRKLTGYGDLDYMEVERCGVWLGLLGCALVGRCWAR